MSISLGRPLCWSVPTTRNCGTHLETMGGLACDVTADDEEGREEEAGEECAGDEHGLEHHDRSRRAERRRYGRVPSSK